MSQNAHTLYLFVEDPIKLKYCQLMYQYLAADQSDEAERWAMKLGIEDVSAVWDAEWFNQAASAQPGHVRLCFDTGTHDDLPLLALETLFAQGMDAAVLEVFYDQVGEVMRMYFSNGQWVSRQAFIEQHAQWRSIVEPTDAGLFADHEGADPVVKDPSKPTAIALLRQQEIARKEKAQENVKDFLELAKASHALGGVKGLVGVLVLRAAIKGLLQGLAFTVITVLLFKGLWLWVSLGLILTIALPLYYMTATYGELKGVDDSGDTVDGSAVANP